MMKVVSGVDVADAPAGMVSDCSLNTDTVPSSAPAIMQFVSGESETHLVSSPVMHLHTISPSRLNTVMPPSATARVDPSPESETSVTASSAGDFQSSRPCRLRRNITRLGDAAATVEPSWDMATRMPLLPVLYRQRSWPSPW